MKFNLTVEQTTEKRQIVQSYIEGLFWVLTYYHHGCASWTWYYPYLYAPLASDLKNLSDLSIEFERGRPFTPLLQLLSVLPPQSSQLLPMSYSECMTDETSPLYKFYPKDFEVDANGKKNSWECVVRIPFIEEEVLIDTISKIDHKQHLSSTERIRNLPGSTHRYKMAKSTSSTVSAEAKNGEDSHKRKTDSNNKRDQQSSDSSAHRSKQFANALTDNRKRH